MLLAWTSEIQADVTVALTNFRHPKTGRKTRQLAIVVAHGYGKRLHEGSANRLFHQMKEAVEGAGIEGIKHWERPDKKKLLPRRAVYQYEAKGASRKFWYVFLSSPFLLSITIRFEVRQKLILLRLLNIGALFLSKQLGSGPVRYGE